MTFQQLLNVLSSNFMIATTVAIIIMAALFLISCCLYQYGYYTYCLNFIHAGQMFRGLHNCWLTSSKSSGTSFLRPNRKIPFSISACNKKQSNGPINCLAEFNVPTGCSAHHQSTFTSSNDTNTNSCPVFHKNVPTSASNYINIQTSDPPLESRNIEFAGNCDSCQSQSDSGLNCTGDEQDCLYSSSSIATEMPTYLADDFLAKLGVSIPTSGRGCHPNSGGLFKKVAKNP